jgi:hypothetical protein
MSCQTATKPAEDRDRGFAAAQLVRYVRELGWQCRIRIQGNFWLRHPHHGWRAMSISAKVIPDKEDTHQPGFLSERLRQRLLRRQTLRERVGPRWLSEVNQLKNRGDRGSG